MIGSLNFLYSVVVILSPIKVATTNAKIYSDEDPVYANFIGTPMKEDKWILVHVRKLF